MGRTDIHVEVPRVAFEKLSDKRTGEPSERVRERVETARAIQRERFYGTDLHINADMGPGEIRQFCPVDQTSTHLLKSATQQMPLSARAHHRILKLAHTIADLTGEADIQTPHIAETIQYRPRQQL
jgi:magnesium chelatase family protein